MNRKKQFLDKILSDLNKTFNSEKPTHKDFKYFTEVLQLSQKSVGPYIKNIYGFNYDDIFFMLVKEWVRSNYGNGNEALPGDTIILRAMVDEKDPIRSGTKGLVVNINSVKTFGEDHLIVKWENGRSLNVIVGLDEYDIVKNTNNQIFREIYE